ncbi:Calcium-transporting ATPase [Bertholletia excelsa]
MLMKSSGVGAGDEAGDSVHAGVLLATGTVFSDDRYRRLSQHGISVVISLNKKGSPPDAAPTSSKAASRYKRLRVLVLCTGVFITLNKKSSHVAIDIPGRDAVDRIVKAQDLQGLTEFGGFERVAAVLHSDLKTGLPCAKFLRCLGKACNSYTVFLLLISCVLSLATEMFEAGPQRGWVDGVTILVAVILIVTVPPLTEFIRARNMKKKTLLEEKKVKVTRRGERQDVAVSGIVEGDVVILKNGDQIPADGLLYSGDGLILDEVVLHSIVNRHQNPFLFSGRKVVEGEGLMIVTSVGTNTALGKEMSRVTDDPNKPTLLQSQIERPNNYAEKIALLLSIIITIVQFVRFLLGNHIHSDDGSQLPELKGKSEVKRRMKMIWRILCRPQGLVCIFTTILTAVVLCFQHGFSVAITLAFSYWNSEVESDHASPRNPFACGTMGFTTVIRIDASGGLMCNQVEIGKFFIGEKEINTEEGLISKKDVYETLQQQIDITPTAEPENPCFLMDHLVYSQVLSEWGMADQSVKEKFGITHKSCGGSAETMLSMCTHYYDCRGKVHGLENETCKFVELIRNMEDSNLHSIAFAHKQSDAEEIRGLILVALVGFKFLEKTKLDMKELQRAGVRIILVTGNELLKAESLAMELGIYRPGSENIAPAGKLHRLNSRIRWEKMKHITVICSASSEDKLLMIQWLKQLQCGCFLWRTHS